jgi:hypothetical protein
VTGRGGCPAANPPPGSADSHNVVVDYLLVSFVKRKSSLKHFINWYPSVFFVWGRKMTLVPTF